MSDNESIENYEIYNKKMQKSALDKMFFLDKVEADVIVDFGCADGSLIKMMSQFLDDETIYIGYDLDEQMVDIAKQNLKDTDVDSMFLSKWNDVKARIFNLACDGKKIAVVLSSIIHEVYHYSRTNEVDEFWKNIFYNETIGDKAKAYGGFGMFDYIVIRDMIPSRTIDRQSSNNDVKKIYSKDFIAKELHDFESIWGSIGNNKSLTHFLLKYQYADPNWGREVKENYFPMYREDLLALIPDHYDISYHEHFVLPYLSNKVDEDFGIEIKDNTHLKLILKKSI
jgi:ribosomal protein L11 methylase PrmA